MKNITHKTEQEVSAGIAGSELFGASRTFSFTYKRKTEEVRGADGLVHAGCERVSQMLMPPAFARGAVARMGGAAFRDLVERLKASSKPLEVRMAEEIAALIDAAGANDTIRLTSSLDERVRKIINDKLAQATALRAGRSGADAAGPAGKAAGWLEAEAQDLLDDPRHYIVSKIQLVPEGRRECVAAEIRFDPAIAQEVHDTPRTQKS